MKGDSVKTALDLVREEIAAVVAQLNHEGIEAFKHSRYQDAEMLGAQGKQLKKFLEKLLALREEWVSSVELNTRERVRVSPEFHPPKHTKGPKKNLRIILPDGHVVQRPTAAAALVDVIERLGVDQVRALRLSVSGVPLVGADKHKAYTQHRLGKWWICTHSNTVVKKELLENIGQALNKKLGVELITSPLESPVTDPIDQSPQPQCAGDTI